MNSLSRSRILYLIRMVFTATLLSSILSNVTHRWTRKFIVSVYGMITGDYARFRETYLISLDKNGIPVVDYGRQNGILVGEQRNPVTISQQALEYHKKALGGSKRSRQYLINCSDWLVQNAVYKDDYAIYEYNFPWPVYQLTIPWRSGMAQGQAIQALVRAFGVTRDEKYLQCARKLLRSFYVECENAGVTIRTPVSGWWYEEYTSVNAQTSRVLNGMLFTVLGIYEYYEYTREREAKEVFDQGVLALKTSLPLYDNNGISTYDILGNPAGDLYHQIHIDLLDRLFQVTEEPIFREYADRWRGYTPPPARPFIVRIFRERVKFDLAIFAVNTTVVFAGLLLADRLFHHKAETES